MDDPGQLLLVVTPRSERGGRWFDPSPRNWPIGAMEVNRPDEGPVSNTGSGSCPLLGSSPTASASTGPRYANVRATQLETGRLWARIPPWAAPSRINGSVG